MDKKLSDLFQQWLAAFGAMQVASSEADVVKVHRTLGEIEAKMVDTPRGDRRACRQTRTTFLLESACRCSERTGGLGLSRPRALNGSGSGGRDRQVVRRNRGLIEGRLPSSGRC